MKPKSIGIVGGAGPLAGAYFFERLLFQSRKLYGCYRDEDFPQIVLLSYPFSEMLSGTVNAPQLQNELSECLNQLKENGCSILAIACSTLHAFLGENQTLSELIHLPSMVAQETGALNQPLVLCTSTSAKLQIHRKFFDCCYPDTATQKQVDGIIDQILKGVDRASILKKLEKVLQKQSAKTVILGCSELSLFNEDLTLTNKLIIDPIEIMAGKILEKSFFNVRGLIC